MSTDAIESAKKPVSLSPSTRSGGGHSDEKRRWDETTGHSGDADSLDVVNYQQGVDVAVDLVAGTNVNEALDAEAAARVRRKIDWHLLPLLFLIYTGAFTSYYQRASYAYC